jgi:acyl CoA:acetate/3-ketoacid CoA transferase beta subunit
VSVLYAKDRLVGMGRRRLREADAMRFSLVKLESLARGGVMTMTLLGILQVDALFGGNMCATCVDSQVGGSCL